MFSGELRFLQLLEGVRTSSLNAIFEFITMLGEETLMVILIAMLWFAFDKQLAKRIFFIAAVSIGINSIIKNIVKLPRPFAGGKVTCVRPDTATGYSFPSGHTQNFSTWTTVLALRIRKAWFSVLVTVLIVLVAFSRMFLGAHYPSDVIIGGLIGVLLAVIGNVVYDRVQNKHELYIASIAVLTPFAVAFMFKPDPMYADFYKTYGMLIGLFFVIIAEGKGTPLNYDVAAWKKVLRVVIGVMVAYFVKEGISALDATEIVQLSFVINTIGYTALVFIALGICPVLFNRFKI